MSRSFATEAETVWAVGDVELSAAAGEFVVIHGPSGSGKSTLLNLVAGLDLADAGEIQVAGRDVAGLDEDGRARMRLDTVGMVFQNDTLVQEFTAAENVAFPLEMRGTTTPDAALAAEGLLDTVGLGGLGQRWPRQSSGGQRQRVGIARALSGDRRILLADEPTGALDSKNSAVLFELVAQLCGAGTLALVCSHDPLCREYADTVYEMVDGMLRPSGVS